MARRTKEEAQKTRSSLLDAAERLFHTRGVSRTSLSEIASEAGATRGAIYWHFKDKADLFIAMMDRVSLPLEEGIKQASSNSDDPDTMERVLSVMWLALEQVVHNTQVQRTFEIAIHKVEYVEELAAVRERRQSICQCVKQAAEQALEITARQRQIKLPIPAQAAAIGLYALVDGLIVNWLINPHAFDLEAVGRQATIQYLKGLGIDLSVTSATGESTE